MALGAQPTHVMRMIVGHAMLLTSVGIVVGGVGSHSADAAHRRICSSPDVHRSAHVRRAWRPCSGLRPRWRATSRAGVRRLWIPPSPCGPSNYPGLIGLEPQGRHHGVLQYDPQACCRPGRSSSCSSCSRGCTSQPSSRPSAHGAAGCGVLAEDGNGLAAGCCRSSKTRASSIATSPPRRSASPSRA